MDKYHPDEVKFFQGFQIDHDENDTLKRVYSLKFKTKELSEKWSELKNKCENDEDKSFLKEWIYQYDENLFKHLSFRQKNNFGFWRQDDDEYKDNDIVILYCEYINENLWKGLEDDYSTRFNYMWNTKVLKAIINDFINYANKYTSQDCVSGKIEFRHSGEKVNVSYLS